MKGMIQLFVGLFALAAGIWDFMPPNSLALYILGWLLIVGALVNLFLFIKLNNYFRRETK